MKADAVVAVAPRTVAFRNVEVPEPGPEDVVVRLRHSWISNGTEGSFIRGERIAGDTPRREGDPLPFPHVPGYQSVGTVVAVGSAVEELRVGQTVAASISKVEGMYFDFAGHVNPGVFPVSQVWAIPDGCDPLAFSGLVLTQVGYNVGMRPAVAPGELAVVIGDGLVGHWAAQTLQNRGARVVTLGRHRERMAKLRARAGSEAASELAETLGSEIAVLAHTAGPIGSVEALYPRLRRGAHVVSAGFVGTEGAMDVQLMRDRELTLHAVAGWTRARMDETLALVAAGELETVPLITHRFPAHRAEEAYRLILDRTEPHLGVVLDWEQR